MERLDRLFVPLSRDPFEDFESRGKIVEVRKYGGNFTEKTVYVPRIVELRLGYSGKMSLWGSINEVVIASLPEVLQSFELSHMVPRIKNLEEALELYKSLLGSAEKYIGFKIDLNL